MKTRNNFLYATSVLGSLIFICLALSACNKSELLNDKPSSSLIIPTTLNDFQSLLDNTNSNKNGDIMNTTPVLGELSTDDYYINNYQDYLAFGYVKERQAYIWAKDTYDGTATDDDWNMPNRQVFYSNVVLDGLKNIKVTASNQTQFDNIKGYALFYRSYALWNLAQVYCPVYDKSSASTDLGLPLHIDPSIQSLPRSSNKDTYDFILSDLKLARRLVNINFQVTNRNRPSSAAILALISRVYVSMRDYTNAGLYADSCLQLYNTLIDYNSLASNGTLTGNYPFTNVNAETLFQSNMSSATTVLRGLIGTTIIVDSNLYKSYNSFDLRRAGFFKLNGSNLPIFKSFYTGFIYPFTGLAVDEVYLTRAECRARAGSKDEAISDLNTLLSKRYSSGTFKPLSASTATEALDLILTERRKELVWRGLRWVDLRRLNKDGANISLVRKLNGQTYTLSPNSPLFVFPIPPDEISQSGIQQNIR